MTFHQKRDDLIASLKAEKHWQVVDHRAKEQSGFVGVANVCRIRRAIRIFLDFLRGEGGHLDLLRYGDKHPDEFIRDTVSKSLSSVYDSHENDLIGIWFHKSTADVLGIDPYSGDPIFPFRFDVSDMDKLDQFGKLALSDLKGMSRRHAREHVMIVVLYVLFIRKLFPQEFLDFIGAYIDFDEQFDMIKWEWKCVNLILSHLWWRMKRLEQRFRVFPTVSWEVWEVFNTGCPSGRWCDCDLALYYLQRYQDFLINLQDTIGEESHNSSCSSCICLYRSTVDYQRRMRKYVRHNGIYFKYPAQNAYIESLFLDIGYQMEEIEFGRKKVFEQHEKMVEKYTA